MMVTGGARNGSFGLKNLAMVGRVHDKRCWFANRHEICFSLPIQRRYRDDRRN